MTVGYPCRADGLALTSRGCLNLSVSCRERGETGVWVEVCEVDAQNPPVSSSCFFVSLHVGEELQALAHRVAMWCICCSVTFTSRSRYPPPELALGIQYYCNGAH